MAIDVKEIIADGLLQLCEEIPLEIITIKQLLEATGVSRQTFYNHFLDKNDLIQYIYLKKIIPRFDDTSIEINFHHELLVAFQNMKKYHVFMKQACMMHGQNCLNDFIFEHCRTFDLEWHQKRYGNEEMPEALRFATEYHATASSSMTLSWILSDMPASCEEMADLITELRSIGMKKLFENAEIKGNPYKAN
ncbi:TetR/AcrR family transcriptional regulator C-terminal domain-containing protein [Clostridium gasigenes]|uniref:TetR/AcrR family transcriptional regulator C-terminal domain-containing protein n=1 Tax=Clostridium gasigenes TaxID=94869 RepID=UPI001C0DF24E|nr:TetR/AcrR family transcriptional regulator C-terminal domain-containing protein [Clostridium gasigenes]MBU3136776.1 TetR/AcrR family transcriptional regulator C-terminal domain-containing protein [Clostridium gasigenes]